MSSLASVVMHAKYLFHDQDEKDRGYDIPLNDASAYLKVSAVDCSAIESTHARYAFSRLVNCSKHRPGFPACKPQLVSDLLRSRNLAIDHTVKCSRVVDKREAYTLHLLQDRVNQYPQ